MNPDDGRLVSDWIREYAAHRVPAHLDAVLRETGGRRQRRAWSIPERWIPMNIATRAGTLAQPRLGRAIVVALVILALIGLAIVAVGSSRHPLPPPFGLARSGTHVTSVDGEIYRMDPATGARAPLIAGPAYDFSTVFSRDGTKFMFLRSSSKPSTTEAAMLSLMVADADGSNLRELVGPVRDLGWFDWSPDGRAIAFNTTPDTDRVLLNVVDVASGKATTLDVGMNAFFATWLPPDGREIVFRGEGDRPGLFAVHPDGSGLRRLNHDPALDQSDFQGPSVAPDGRSITFERRTGSESRIYVLDLATGTSRILPTPPGTSQHAYAVFSPDAQQVAYWRTVAGGADDLQLVLAPADGSSPGRVIGPNVPGGTGYQPVTFTPDGRAIIASVGSDDDATVWRVPVDGSPSTELTSGSFNFVDVQRLAP